MGRVEAIDSEVGLSVGPFFLMTHGRWVEPTSAWRSRRISKAQRVQLPDPVAAVLLHWVKRTYGF